MIDPDEAWMLEDISDDVYGLWEVDWSLNTRGFPQGSESRVALLESLLRKGLIEVRFGRLGDLSPVLSDEDALLLIRDPSAWLPRKTPDQPITSVTTSKLADKTIIETQMRDDQN